LSVEDIHPSDGLEYVITEFEAQARGEKLLARDIPCVRKDGSVIHADITTTAAAFRGERCNIGFFTDVTERQQLEEERLKMSRLDSLGVLAGGIAHDFNNLLTAIQGNIEVARFDCEIGSRSVRSLEHASQACTRAAELTQQLLTFARGGTPVRTTASMAQLLTDSVTFALRGSTVRVEFAIADDLRGVDMDVSQMSRAIQNLVLNAVAAMPDGGTLTVSAMNVLGHDCDDSSPRVRITIRDTGSGIPPHHLPRVFDPYYTTSGEGRGLGLAIVYSIVNRHQGTIDVRSKVDSFTEFTIELPASTECPGQRDESEPGEPAAIRGRVLVVDDDELVMQSVCAMLDSLGFEPVGTLDGHDALRVFGDAAVSGKPFDLCILDLTMRGGYGGERIVRDIKQLDSDAQCLVSTGYSTNRVLDDLAGYGFDGSLTKPYSLAQLRAELARVLSAR
jgi:signal transduction histidine kinase